MDIFEISGYGSGIDRSGVNFLDPKDAFELLQNAYVYRQQILSRKGFKNFGNRLPSTPLDNTRVMGIFENTLPDSSLQLLVIDKNYLYKFNSTSNAFELIPNGSAGIDVYPFGIVNNEDYVTGTTYLKADGSQRFVFTGLGMSDIYFYDGTSVKRFTNTTDNPNYQAPAAGALRNATRLIWFGERLNLLQPTIGGQIQPQSILYSAIRNAAGNGDKFNTVGAGTIIPDTYEILKSGIILGDVIILNFQKSNWVLEKTRDPFNPYFVRKVPSVLGTDARFSTVTWDYEVKSLGITGLITTDGRQSKRFDDLIYQFTDGVYDQSIDENMVELTYGGFDRQEGQFLWSYRSNEATEEDNQDKTLVYNYEEGTWAYYDWTFSVFGETYGGNELAWDDIDETIDPSWKEWNTTEEVWNKIGVGQNYQKTLAGDNEGFIYEINSGYDDYFNNITGITQASSAVISMDGSPFSVGQVVYVDEVEGMTEINGQTLTVIAVGTDSITVDIDSTNFTAYSAAGYVSSFIEFNAQTTVFNPYRDQGRKCCLSHVEVLIDNTGISLYMDVIENEQSYPFKTVLLETDGNSTNKRKWITVIVNDESEFFTFVFRGSTISRQVIIPAIRIHCSAGGLTAG